MRPDQRARLDKIAERLVDVFEKECDDTQWPGAEIPAASMTRETRGDRYWAKKNAAATLTLVVRIQTAVKNSLQNDLMRLRDPQSDDEIEPATVEAEADIDRDIDQYEHQAAKAIEAAQRRMGRRG